MRKTNIRDLAKPRVVRQSRKSQKWLEKTGTVFRTGQDENVFGQTFACLPRTRESRVPSIEDGSLFVPSIEDPLSRWR